MKKLIPLIIFISICTVSSGQKSKFLNVTTQPTVTSDTLQVNYDLTGKRKALIVWLEATREGKTKMFPKDISGDIKNVSPGMGKKIFWNLIPEDELREKEVNLHVCGRFEKGRRIPWLYIASGVCAATGVYSHIRYKQIYEDYPPSAVTREAEDLHKDARRMEIIRNAAFGAAGGLAVAGVIVHIRHNQGKNAVAFNYIPVEKGASFGLTYNF